MLEKILVPVDGSAEALNATQYARKLAEKLDCAITLIHVIQQPVYIESGNNHLTELLISSLDENGNKILEQALEIFRDFVGRVTTRLEYGHPGVKITEISKEYNYSLIIMGRRGRNEVTKLLLGSVSNYVLHYAYCPTLIVPTKVTSATSILNY